VRRPSEVLPRCDCPRLETVPSASLSAERPLQPRRFRIASDADGCKPRLASLIT
jgi:hypothetical protein